VATPFNLGKSHGGEHFALRGEAQGLGTLPLMSI
jgi:hypothetical protein